MRYLLDYSLLRICLLDSWFPSIPIIYEENEAAGSHTSPNITFLSTILFADEISIWNGPPATVVSRLVVNLPDAFDFADTVLSFHDE